MVATGTFSVRLTHETVPYQTTSLFTYPEIRKKTKEELAAAKRAKELSNDKWRGPSSAAKKNGMPVAKILSTRERARLEKKGKKK